MMSIVMASDQNYEPHLETLIVSIGENNRNADEIQIHILDNGISESCRKYITGLSSRYINLLFRFYELREDQIAEQLGGNVAKDRSLSAYARIFIPALIEGDRALYLDVDGIVCDSLEGLYNCDMSGYAIAGVLDTNPISRHRNVELKDEHPYVCSGMLLFNLNKCRDIHFTEQCIAFVKAHDGKVDAMDQGTINGVCGGQGLTKVVHPKYDVLTSLYQLNSSQIRKMYSLPNYYSDTEILEARAQPVFIHYTPNMTTRPWIEHCTHPKREEYWKYRKMTEYKAVSYLKDNRSLKLRVLGMVYRRNQFLYSVLTRMR